MRLLVGESFSVGDIKKKNVQNCVAKLFARSFAIVVAGGGSGAAF